MVNLLHHLNIPKHRLEYALEENRTLSSAARLAANIGHQHQILTTTMKAGSARAGDSGADDEPTATGPDL